MLFKKYIHPFWYAFADYITAAIAWGLFYFVRKIILVERFEVDFRFWLGILLIPAGWLVWYALLGSYHSIYKKSRLSELTKVFICSIIGCTVLFFLFLLDDVKQGYSYYYKSFGALFGLQLTLTFLGRLFVLNGAKKQLVNKTIQFNAIMVGVPAHAIQIYKEAKNNLAEEGYHVSGLVTTAPDKNGSQKELPKLGTVDELEELIDQYKIELVVLA
ncbi:MAG: hypothetical protein M3Y85_12110, partial [Bacteroidota bacterium]|nr:hypothetical protein [Bacteroidota bacterium]